METEGLGLWSTVFRTYYKSIILFTVLGIGASTLYTMYMMKPAYMAESTILFTSSAGQRVSMSSELQSISTYTQLLSSEKMASQVASQIGMNIPPQLIQAETSIQADPSSLVVAIGVRDSNPEFAKKVASSYASVAQDFLPTLLPGSNVQVIDYAQDAHSIKPKRKTYIFVGTVLGLMVGIGLSFSRHSIRLAKRNRRKGNVAISSENQQLKEKVMQ